MAKTIELDQNALEYGLEIIKEITDFRPFSSISFQTSDQIEEAVRETSQLTAWGMAKNKSKMKKTAIRIMNLITDTSPGEPVNLNLTKYERKSLKAVLKLLKRSLNSKKDGVVLK